MTDNALKIPNDLTTAQWRLHDYIINQPNWVHFQAIADGLGYDYNPCKYFGNTGVRRRMTDDIKAIQLSAVVQHVFITHPAYGVKAVTKEEYEQFYQTKNISLKTSMGNLSTLDKKASKDGQFRIVQGEQKPCTEAFKPIGG